MTAAALVIAAAAYGVLGGRAGVLGSSGSSGRAAAAPRTSAVVLIVDVSGSMRATDVRPTRLAAAVAAMRTFVDRLPKGVEVGIVSFSTGAEVVLQPTADRAAAAAALGRLGPQAGTALGSGLAAATSLAADALRREGIRRVPGRFLPAAIVLESDGAQNRGPTSPADAALAAKRAGIRVYGVALGTPNGTVTAGPSAITVPVPPDPATVRSIARVTRGEAFAARTAAELNADYARLAATIGG